jgi:hypothetical protein
VNARELPSSSEIGTEVGCYYSERTSARKISNKEIRYRVDNFSDSCADNPRIFIQNGIVKER